MAKRKILRKFLNVDSHDMPGCVVAIPTYSEASNTKDQLLDYHVKVGDCGKIIALEFPCNESWNDYKTNVKNKKNSIKKAKILMEVFQQVYEDLVNSPPIKKK